MILWLLPLTIWFSVGLINIGGKNKISKCEYALCWISLILALTKCMIG